MLKLGELSTILSSDDKPLEKGLVEAKTKLGKFWDQAKTSAKIGAAAVGAAAAAALVGAIGEADIGGKIAAKLGLEGDAAASAGALAGKIYADNFGESMSEVGDALTKVMRSQTLVPAGTDAEIQSVTEKALTLSNVFGQDLARSIQAAEQLIRNGLARNATEAFDLITAGIQQGADKSDDLLDTLNEYPTVLRDLGLSGQQALGLIQQGLKAGARDSDTVADALKEFAIRGQDASATSAAGFKILGINAANATAAVAAGGPRAAAALGEVLNKLQAMTDPVQRNAAAVALFGTKAEDLGDALFSMDLDTASAQLGNFAGATQRAADAAGGTAAQQIEGLKRAIVGTFQDKLASAIPIIKTVFGWLQKHKDVVGPLANVLLAFAVAVGALAVAAKVYAAAQWLANSALLAFPLTWIIIAIITLIATIWVLVANWDTVWARIKSGGESVWNWLKGIPGWLGGLFASVGRFIANPFIKAFNWIIQAYNATIGQINFDNPFGGGHIGFPTLGQIPELAKGGVIPATPGGRIFRAGEAGEDEIVAPDSRLHQIIRAELARREEAAPPAEVGDLYVAVQIGDEPIRTVVRAERVKADQRTRQWVLAAQGGRR